MKKIILLCGIIMCCLSSYASIAFTASPASVASPGGSVTVTTSGEASSGYITSITATPYVIYSSPTTPSAAGSVTSVLHYYNTGTGSPTTFTFNATCSATGVVNVTYVMQVVVRNDVANTNTTTYYPITVSFNSATLYYNVAESGPFTRNNCTTPAYGTTVTYTVPANTYSASTQTAANTLAMNAVTAGGQAYANVNGSCCSGQITTMSVDGSPIMGTPSIYAGYHTLSFTYSGTPNTITFANGPYTTISSTVPASYPYTPSGGNASCYFYYSGGGFGTISIKFTNSCGTLTTTNVPFMLHP